MSDLAVHNDLHPTERRWFAVYTRARSEKWVQRALTKKGIYAYVPLQRLYRRYTRSTRLTEKPLIPGYVFVHINWPDYIPVLETEHVAGFVRFSKNLIAIPGPEIVLLRRITWKKTSTSALCPEQLKAATRWRSLPATSPACTAGL
ncbi:MAG: transcription termination/antitermination NusG family protein [Saprospirales bacterium]|nr:transcription termination/antitermination NusG family protein [Saprospirales bacterium]